MPGVAGSRHEGLEDPLIQEVLRFAKGQQLDLSVSRDRMNPWDIQVEERVDPDYVKRVARALKKAGEWPETMPLPVIMTGVPTIMDGSHRTTAARVADFDLIPVLVADSQAYFAVNDKFDIPMFEYVHSILPAVDPLMRENEQKDEQGGRLKKRTADSWDMDAFAGWDAIGLGSIRRGPKGQRGAPAGYLYHSTFADRAVEIARDGLQPSESPRWGGDLGDWSLGKVFFSGHISAAAFYAAHHFSNALMDLGRSSDPILLRLRSEFLTDAERDTASWDDWFIERVVPPAKVEAWTPWLEDWMPIRSVAADMVDMETVRGEPEELDVDPEAGANAYTEAYIKQVWPQDAPV